MKTLDAISRVNAKLANALVVVAGIVAFILMMMIVTDITGRYLFSAPLTGTFETVEVAMVLLVFFAVAAAETVGEGMIRVTFLFERFSPRMKAWARMVGDLAAALLCALMAWRGFYYAIDTFIMGETTIMVRVPIWPFRLTIGIGCALLSFIFLINSLRAARGRTTFKAEIEAKKGVE